VPPALAFLDPPRTRPKPWLRRAAATGRFASPRRAGLLARPGLMYRAAMEGATLSLLSGFRRMCAAGLTPGRELRLVSELAPPPSSVAHCIRFP
jgi:hypothetical protein